jgi:Cu(I)/Ag(I) efflux system membrane fusion protein
MTRRYAAVIVLGLALVTTPLLFTSCRGASRQDAESRYEYFCVMHPQIVQDEPGHCPICQMTLEKREKGHGAAATGAVTHPARRTIAFYRNPMNPAVHSPVPTKDEMGMDYVPVYEDEQDGGTAGGRSTILLPAEKRRLLGVRSEPVRQAEIDTSFRTVGRVAVDERHVHHVHTKFEAYVERLFVDYTGKAVRRGEPLLALYSPELLATEQEYLLAFRSGDKDLRESARRRLLLWDISPDDIARIEKSGEPLRTLNLYAPMDGYVLQKTAFHGMRVTPVDTLFEIANLSDVWIVADVYEQDLPRVAIGATATISASHVPGRTWPGRVTFIAPTLDEATRTVKVRIEVENQDAALKPEMFTDVELRRHEGRGLVIPESAAVDTGTRQIVFVDHDDGTLEPRAVSLGTKAGNVFPVRSGLSEGERVVVSANFLVDSESSLKAAIAAAGR